MKLNFRDLKQQKFTIDAEPSDTIGQVKEKIASEKGWEASTQKLIYSGKILADANTVESYKIEEKGFIVCMVSKPKAAPAPKPAPPSTPQPAAPVATPAQPPAPQQNSATTAPSNPPATPSPAQSATATAPSEAQDPFGNPSAMLMGNRNQEAINSMEQMGFERAEIERALRAAYFNPDRAVDYLLNGIPDSVRQEQRPPPQQQAPAGQQAPTSPTPAAAGTTQPQTQATQLPAGEVNLFEAAARAGQQGPGTGRGGAARGATAAAGGGAEAGGPGAGGQMNLDYLRQSPHFQQLRQLVQQQPAMLEPILQQVAEGNPQLAQMIGSNQEQFLSLLAENEGGEGGGLPPGAIAVTQEESDAIDRLCGLGFPRDRVIQAYFACDKNEELAANFLFEQPDEDD